MTAYQLYCSANDRWFNRTGKCDSKKYLSKLPSIKQFGISSINKMLLMINQNDLISIVEYSQTDRWLESTTPDLLLFYRRYAINRNREEISELLFNTYIQWYYLHHPIGKNLKPDNYYLSKPALKIGFPEEYAQTIKAHDHKSVFENGKLDIRKLDSGKLDSGNKDDNKKLEKQSKLTSKECKICKKEFKLDVSVMALPCLHIFHSTCYQMMVCLNMGVQECPLCDRVFELSELLEPINPNLQS